MIFARILATTLLAAAAFGAQAGGLEGFVGQKPATLLKKEAPFAKAYRSALKGADLPPWTRQLAGGFPAEAVELDGQTLILISACSRKGCTEERLYVFYEPGDQSITGFFFLPPDPDNPGDNRMAFSRWFGKMPTPARNEWLLERAMKDAQPVSNLTNR